MYVHIIIVQVDKCILAIVRAAVKSNKLHVCVCEIESLQNAGDTCND